MWAAIRDFDAVPRLFAGVASVELEGAARAIGSTRTVKWASGEEVTQALVEQSDQRHRLAWETVAANHATESSAQISSIRLFRITETRETLVEWATDYAADVDAKTVQLQRDAIMQNLKDIRTALKKKN